MLWVFNCYRYILVILWIKVYVLQGRLRQKQSIQCLSRTCNFKVFLIVLLALPIFLLHEVVRPQCRYVLTNLATWYCHTEYLIYWMRIYPHIKPNCRYCLRKSLDCYRIIIGNTCILRLLMFYFSIDIK